MKYTRKQKQQIIKVAIRTIRKYKAAGICWAITSGLNSIKPSKDLKMIGESKIQRIFPQFGRSVAIKYFKANDNTSCFWWAYRHRIDRIRFLQYLLDGKLPKKKVSKKK